MKDERIKEVSLKQKEIEKLEKIRDDLEATLENDRFNIEQ
jgi:hypothetical protein